MTTSTKIWLTLFWSGQLIGLYMADMLGPAIALAVAFAFGVKASNPNL
jgi:hypothetical protein